jgi:acyl-coenzyme A synthetase/AMP-(fatty) acid ligase
VVPVDGTVYGDPKRFVDTYFSTAAGDEDGYYWITAASTT